MKRWKRGAAMLLCLCMMTALLAGCGRGRSGENTASVVMTGSVSTVDPAYAATPAERTLVLHLFDNLYRDGRGFRVRLAAAGIAGDGQPGGGDPVHGGGL